MRVIVVNKLGPAEAEAHEEPRVITVIYRSRMHAKTKRNFEIFSAEKFIAAITQHIPDKGFQTRLQRLWLRPRRRHCGQALRAGGPVLRMVQQSRPEASGPSARPSQAHWRPRTWT